MSTQHPTDGTPIKDEPKIEETLVIEEKTDSLTEEESSDKKKKK